MSDIVEVYRRILKAAAKGRGVRLSPEECHAFHNDQAVEQAIASADDEEDTGYIQDVRAGVRR